MQNKGILMVISGFSGAGKGTLVKKLLSEYDNYALSISMTTRQPREGEEDGREYFFRTREQFEENIAKTFEKIVDYGVVDDFEYSLKFEYLLFK